MQGVDVQPHILLSKKDIKPVCLVYGDPARGQIICDLCEKSVKLAANREYVSYNVTHNGEEFTIISHGVGASGCAVCISELIELGATDIIRAGTAGSLQPDSIKMGDVVICNAAAKEDGVTKLLEPEGAPAIAAIETTMALRDAAAKKGWHDVKTGTTVSSDLFYKPTAMPATLQVWRDCGIDVVEMEASAIFVLARQHKIRSGCIVSVDGSPFHHEDHDYDPHGTIVKGAKEKMLTIAIDACAAIAKERRLAGNHNSGNSPTTAASSSSTEAI